MSTRSLICCQNSNGSYDVIYCHFDGTPAHNGRILHEHYACPEKIAALFALGDLSVLAPEIGEKHSFEQRNTRWCFAYGRDYGETDTQAAHVEDYDALCAMLEQSWAEWVYIYRVAEARWYYTNNPSPVWIKDCGEQRETALLTPSAWQDEPDAPDIAPASPCRPPNPVRHQPLSGGAL
jgi:hypothetical protein